MNISSNPLKPFTLVSKKLGIPLSEYKGELLKFLPDSFFIEAVDEVIVQKTNDPSVTKKIVTYRNFLGKIVERVFENTAEYSSRIISQVYNQEAELIGENIYRQKSTTKYFLKKGMKNSYLYDVAQPFTNTEDYRYQYWKPLSTVADCIKYRTTSNDVYWTRRSVKFSDSELFYEHQKITQYPKLHQKSGKFDSFDKNEEKKVVEMAVQTGRYEKNTIKELRTSPNVKLSTNDEYLPYRAYNTADSRVPLTKHFLSKNDVIDLKIPVDIETMKNPSQTGRFNPMTGDILLNRNYNFVNKFDVVDTAAHESKHAYQHSIMGRTGCDIKPYFNQRALYIKGPLKDKESIQKGIAYTEADFNYPDLSTQELITKNTQAWMDNLLEKEATQDGIKACKDYLEQVEEIRNVFPHVPAFWL